MKKLFKSIVLVCLSVSLSFATEIATKQPTSFEVGMYNVKNSNLLKVFVEKKSREVLCLKIKNVNGDVVLNQYFGKRDKKVGMEIDLEALENGKYQMEFSTKNESYIKEIEVKKGKTVQLDKKIIL
ncbi:hypothetical protein [Lacihabitans lacunae]|jgi:hypothetical protein|uniref:Secretion system C-terminal sorting domain-containing protein n=1 Tax=Lacihabitans lacunae TaxID=1028214 RepID=A0ABV7YWE2_9BACT